MRLRVMITLLAVAVAGLLYYLLLAPGRSPESRREQLQSLEAEQAQLQARVAELRALTVRVQDATKLSQEFAADNFIGRTNAFSTMVKNLQDLAVKNEVYPSGITYNMLEGTNELGWNGVEVKLSLAGEYADVVRFINSVEKSNVFWIIRGLTVMGGTESRLRLTLTAETYLLPS
jgi:Tfp pilus assembly protein PilO